MGDENSVYGFELLQQLHNNQILKKEDVIILFVHWYLTKLGFRCIGTGRSEEFEPSEKGSQLLPEEWNTKQMYELRYIKDKKLYLLIVLKTNNDEDLLINLWKNQDSTTSIQIPINQTVTDIHGSLESIIPSYQHILYTVRKDLTDPHLSAGSTKTITEQSTQTVGQSDPNTHDTPFTDPLREPPRNRRIPTRDPPGVGAADLNPFSGGGGMLFDPFDMLRNQGNRPRPGLFPGGRLPPGAIPPYARFDPLGPIDPDPTRNPGNYFM